MAERTKIVYIEDDQDMIDLVGVILSRDNFEIVGVREGQKALETIRQVKPALVLLDLMLPDMGGWEVYQAIKQELTMRDIRSSSLPRAAPPSTRCSVSMLPKYRCTSSNHLVPTNSGTM